VDESIKRLREIVAGSKNVCVFTGAGISCPSGIPDFRSAHGLYNQSGREGYTPEQIISHSFFEEKPELFYQFYKEKMLYPDAQPNDAHLFFAGLEKRGKNVSVVTQNIDGLHQKAGSTRVMELHGSVHRNHCTKCGKFYSLEDILKSEGVPRCDLDGGIIKPDVVLYEEPLDSGTIYRTIDAIAGADTLLVVGTSLMVYPAASFIRYFRGKNLVLINQSATSFDSGASLVINDDIVRVVRQLQSKE